MRGKRFLAMAVRDQVVKFSFTKRNYRILQFKLDAVPFLRGILALWDSLSLGTRMINLSSNMSGTEEEQIDSGKMFFTTALAMIIGVSIFFLLPAFLAGIFDKFWSLGAWWSNVIEGFIRLLILISYMALVGTIPDIKRVLPIMALSTKQLMRLKQTLN